MSLLQHHADKCHASGLTDATITAAAELRSGQQPPKAVPPLSRQRERAVAAAEKRLAAAGV